MVRRKRKKIRIQPPRIQETSPLSGLIVLLSGVLGILFFLGQLEGVTFQGFLVYGAALLMGVSLWFLYGYYRKWFLLFVCSNTLILAIITAFFRGQLAAQALWLSVSLSGRGEGETYSITFLSVLLAILVTQLFFMLEIMMRRHMTAYFLTTALMLMAPMTGVPMNLGSVLMLLIFQLVFWVLHASGSRRGYTYLAEGQRLRIQKKSTRVIALVLLVCVISSVFLAGTFSENLYEAVYQTEGFLYRSLVSMTGQAVDPVSGGKINKGNNYQTGTEHIRLQTSRLPEEPIYLRGFAGGDYMGGEWIRSSDEGLFKKMEKTLHWEEWSYLVSNMYYSMYYVINNKMPDSFTKERDLLVLHTSGKYDNFYVPYYSIWNSQWYQDPTRDAFFPFGEEGYSFQYFEQKDMNIDWEYTDESYHEQREWYVELRDAYKKEAQTAYTKVPVSLLPRLTRLVYDHPLEKLDEITAFILYTLQSNTKYTLTPGRAPRNKDIVEYFLFDNQKGYCQHYASTATLLYRLYGVPARYASGYIVSPGEFQMQDDGGYYAYVTDRSAHAWVEIFLEDYGWTPVEVTPSSDGTISTSYPGFNGSRLKSLLSQHNWNVAMPSISHKEEEMGSSQGKDGFLEFHLELAPLRPFLRILGIVLLYSLILLPFFLDYRRLRKLRKLEHQTSRQVFDRMIRLLHFGKKMLGYEGEEPEFFNVLSKEMPLLSSQEIERMKKILEQAAYGQSPPTPEDQQWIRDCYGYLSEKVYQEQSWWRKLVFRYVIVLE